MASPPSCPRRPARTASGSSAGSTPSAASSRASTASAPLGHDVSSDLLVVAQLLDEASGRSRSTAATELSDAADALRAGSGDVLFDDEDHLLDLFHASLARSAATASATVHVDVERERAGHGAWYELFPRSWPSEPGRHGTLRDVATQVGYVAEMGFDVLYLPPIHPIGETNRKGRNNVPRAEPDEPGSPWAIGSADGGHDAIHPDLGDHDDLRTLVTAADDAGLELALDIAFQCSPDHPWVREHPEWFRHRPDGTIQYAENPPKRYEDIYPLDFETDDWLGLWSALRDVVLYWIDQGVRIFRVDNPHTKPFAFWEWMIGEVRAQHPDVIFLSEAFTRPR
ncbi:MAG: alpha-amylase family glycosyl hydrolase [Acidimicrobiia bacterium]|nr:alpha-amylase family glycosyl hydrolase [Acidimicrobiia bacterium]